MLQRISTAEAELGMFIERLEGNWFRHPFWKRRFLLTDPDDLAVLLESSVRTLVIDTERGRADAVRETSPAARNPALPASVAVPRTTPVIRSTMASDSHSAAVKDFGAAEQAIRNSERIVSKVFLKARLGQAVDLGEVEPVIEEIHGSISRNQFAFAGLLRCKEHKSGVYRHALSVSALMIALARTMRLPPQAVREAGLAGLMCDVGVGQMPESLETVGGDYRALALYLLPQHIFFGHDMMASSPDASEAVLRACLDHHERLDGSGYPQGLRGDQIGRLARMIALCDEFDYLVSGGFHSPPLDPAEAIAQITRRTEEFDGSLINAFVESVGVYPIGTFLALESGRLAMVVGVSPFAANLPTVRAFYSLDRKAEIRPVTIDLSCSYGDDRIVAIADMDGLELPDPAYLRARLLTAAYRK